MSMIQEADMLSAHNLSSADFKARNLNYVELLNISADFESKKAAYDEIGSGVVKILFKFDAVHAIKYEIKNSEELMQQLINYKQQNPDVVIDLNNYESLIENLISIRIIPLFKSDWSKIHDNIVDHFVLMDKVTANVRAEDTASTTKEFTDKGCNLIIHADGYRSVDYIIKTAPSKKEYKVAVQVRSIFEEGWAEIDHSARYQYQMDGQILNEFSKTMNKLAGGADEMAEFIHGLKAYLLEKENLVLQQQHLVEEQEALVKEQQNQIEDLKAALAKSQLELELEKKPAITDSNEQLSNKGSEGMLGKHIIEDLAKTAANVGADAIAPSAVQAEQMETITEENPAKSEEKPKIAKSKADKPKAVKVKEEKVKEEKIKEEKPRLEMAPPVVEDLFGQTRIPDAAPLKPSTTNA
ncbi:hypothetical protein [Pedobacter gandavensis]|uniref:hypothetical protein n=1 Tax=Pedobacter gandavensis TaxID=2679963 RepID=UPI0029317987|nr:hypothetical protein [Pedobacter gandavensis]